MRTIICTTVFAAMLALAPGMQEAWAGLPLQMNHQGFVQVDGTPFAGTGTFRFALVTPSSGNVWTNDGSFIGFETMPQAGVLVPVAEGHYSVLLGKSPMTPLHPDVFAGNSNLSLRIWFDDGTNGPQLLSPDIVVTSNAYAFWAERAGIAVATTSCEPGSVNSSAIVNGSVESEDLADGAALTEILDDDGAGSTLDADMLDGMSSSQFVSTSGGVVSGDLDITGEVETTKVTYSTPRTHYLMVPGTAFHPVENVDYRNSLSNQGAYLVGSVSGGMSAPVYLPDGAEVTELRSYFYDSSESNISVLMHLAYTTGNVTTMAATESDGASGYMNDVNDSILLSTVDNTVRGYQLYAYSTGWDGNDLRVMAVRITYTIDEAP